MLSERPVSPDAPAAYAHELYTNAEAALRDKKNSLTLVRARHMRRLILPRTKSYNKLIDNFLILSSFCEALLTSRGLLKALQKAICWVDRDFEISGKVEEGERQTWCEQEAKQIKKLINQYEKYKKQKVQHFVFDASAESTAFGKQSELKM